MITPEELAEWLENPATAKIFVALRRQDEERRDLILERFWARGSLSEEDQRLQREVRARISIVQAILESDAEAISDWLGPRGAAQTEDQ